MNLLILGANSDVAYAVARRFAGAGKTDLILASRDMALLQKKAKDLEIRCNARVRAVAFDVTDTAAHPDFYEGLTPRPDGVFLACGYLGDQNGAQADFQQTRRIIETNFTGAVSILEIAAADFQRRGRGVIIAMSSVAGDRGRQSNYLYGAAKGALTIYLSGLRNRLCKHGVRVITVLPGFIDTKMTADMALPGLLTASPEQVAEDIFSAFKKSGDVVYTRWFWRWIMVVIRAIPEFVFKRLSL